MVLMILRQVNNSFNGRHYNIWICSLFGYFFQRTFCVSCALVQYCEEIFSNSSHSIDRLHKRKESNLTLYTQQTRLLVTKTHVAIQDRRFFSSQQGAYFNRPSVAASKVNVQSLAVYTSFLHATTYTLAFPSSAEFAFESFQIVLEHPIAFVSNCANDFDGLHCLLTIKKAQ